MPVMMSGIFFGLFLQKYTMEYSIFRNSKNIIFKIIQKINTDNIFNMSAALAYYTVFSLVPLLYIIINSLGLIFDKEEISLAIFTVLSDLIGGDGAKILEQTLTNIVVDDSSWLYNLLGVLLLIFTATTIFSTIQKGLNFIFRVKPIPGVGIFNFLKTRLLSFSIIIGISFILIASLMINTFFNLGSKYIVKVLPGIEFLTGTLNNYLLPFIISFAFFALLFKYLPDAQISWKDVAVGAVFTSLLLTIGRFFIGIYLGNSNIGSLYNAAGSIMIIFIWMYYTAFMFYIGAIFTVIYAEELGSGVFPEKNTLRFVQKEVKTTNE